MILVKCRALRTRAGCGGVSVGVDGGGMMAYSVQRINCDCHCNVTP